MWEDSPEVEEIETEETSCSATTPGRIKITCTWWGTPKHPLVNPIVVKEKTTLVLVDCVVYSSCDKVFLLEPGAALELCYCDFFIKEGILVAESKNGDLGRGTVSALIIGCQLFVG